MVADHGAPLFLEVIAMDASQHRDGDKADIWPWLFLFLLYFYLFSSCIWLLETAWSGGLPDPGYEQDEGVLIYVFLLLAYLCHFWPGIGPDLLGSIIGDGFCRPRVVYWTGLEIGWNFKQD
jgi:hypothetical protein